MNISFRIQKGRVNKLGKGVILVGLTWQGERVYVSSGQLVDPAAFTPHWPENERLEEAQLVSPLDTNSVALNEYFSRLKSDIQEGFQTLERVCGRTKPITPDMVRKMVRHLTGTGIPEPEAEGGLAPAKNIWRYYEEWLVHNRHKLSKKRLHRFDKIWHWLDDYAPGLELVVLDEEWVLDFANWVLKTENPFTDEVAHDGTISKHLSFFRTMLKFAKMPYEWLDSMTVITMPVVTLSYPELLVIRNTVYFDTKCYTDEELRQTADQYLLLAQLGIRYRDWKRIAQEDVEVITVHGRPQHVLSGYRQARKASPLIILLSNLAEEIWTKYEGTFDIISKLEFNERLKYVEFAARLPRKSKANASAIIALSFNQLPLGLLLTARTARHTAAALALEGNGLQQVSQVILSMNHEASSGAQARNLQKIADSLEAGDVLNHLN